jgi:hypothetical protein
LKGRIRRQTNEKNISVPLRISNAFVSPLTGCWLAKVFNHQNFTSLLYISFLKKLDANATNETKNSRIPFSAALVHFSFIYFSFWLEFDRLLARIEDWMKTQKKTSAHLSDFEFFPTKRAITIAFNLQNFISLGSDIPPFLKYLHVYNEQNEKQPHTFLFQTTTSGCWCCDSTLSVDLLFISDTVGICHCTG